MTLSDINIKRIKNLRDIDGISDPMTIAKIVFDQDQISMNSKEFRAVKEALVAGDEYILSPNQIKTIKIQFQKDINTRPTDLASDLFGTDYTQMQLQSIELLKDTMQKSRNREFAEALWIPPKAIADILERLNLYLNTNYVEKKLTPREIRQLNSMISYLNTPIFRLTINEYEYKDLREIFESTFIRYTYNKEDLDQEDIDTYITVCSDVVEEFELNREISQLKIIVEEILNTDKNVKHSKYDTITKLITDKTTRAHACRTRQINTREKLNGKRTEKIKESQRKGTVADLYAAFADKMKRDKLALVAHNHKKALQNEVKRLQGIEAINFEIFGLSQDEAING